MSIVAQLASENLDLLISEVENKHLTVIVSGDGQEKEVTATRLAAILPGRLIEEYHGNETEPGMLIIIPHLTALLEQDASLILRIESSLDFPLLTIVKNRTGHTGKLRFSFV